MSSYKAGAIVQFCFVQIYFFLVFFQHDVKGVSCFYYIYVKPHLVVSRETESVYIIYYIPYHSVIKICVCRQEETRWSAAGVASLRRKVRLTSISLVWARWKVMTVSTHSTMS